MLSKTKSIINHRKEEKNNSLEKTLTSLCNFRTEVFENRQRVALENYKRTRNINRLRNAEFELRDKRTK